eukprot:GFUD01090908.1.p1 GENE.GFUD01090908.1~~GFUD01090908.1.p1  ORF type:complete len:244 (+),score=79.71 GFUD01090908.1:77-808(+)
MERVGWHPVGMYEKRRPKSATFCYTLITIALLAGTVAVVVSWLLATGVIDPDRRQNFKEPRRLDIFTDLNKFEAEIKKVTFPPKPSANASKPATTSEMTEKVELDLQGTSTKTNATTIAVDEETTLKVVAGSSQGLEITTEIENLEKTSSNNIDTDELLEPETEIDSTEEGTNQSNNTTYRSETQKDGPETTDKTLVPIQEVTETPGTTILQKTKAEEKTDTEESTEPYTVPTPTLAYLLKRQ